MIVITGASGSIGKAIATHLAFTISPLEESILSMPAGGIPLPPKIIKTPTHAEMPVESAQAVNKYFANLSNIEILICAHGLYGEASRVENSDPWQWRYALEVNLLGTYNVCRFALSKMCRNGLIINIAGGGGMGDPVPFISSYGCSKAGIVSFTKTLAAEHPDLRVNCIFPGMQDGEIHDRLLAAGPEGNPAYPAIKKMRETGEGAIPVRNTLKLIDRMIDERFTGKVCFARTGNIQ